MKSLRKLRNSKKGVSPLIATVLLIAFAVALGAVVMNWGNQQVRSHVEEIELCKEVSLSWYSFNSREQICYSDSKIMFTLENGAELEVEDLKIIVVGEKDVFNQEGSITKLRKSDIRKAEVAYDMSTYGTPQEVRLVPIILIDKNKVVCSAEHALIKQSPNNCDSK